MNKRFFAVLPILAIVGLGCDSSSAGKDASTPPSSTNPTPASAPESSPSSATTPVTPAGQDSKPVTPNSQKPIAITQATKPGSAVAVPSQLASEGYEYSGVSRTKPLDMEMTMSEQPGTVTTGSQTVTLKETKDGKSVYTVDRSGGLAMLGTEEWTITKEGVFATKSSVMNFGDNAMELPAVPKPGMTWKIHPTADTPTGKLDMVVTFKVIGKESVSTKAGKFNDALLIDEDGVGTAKGHKIRTKSQGWYVKGLGLVKETLQNQGPDGKTQSISIEVTKS